MAFIAIMAAKRRAVLLQHDEIYDEEGWRMVVKIWKVPTSRNSPDGIDYPLSLISPEGERVVGYDNHWPKGHHRHVLGEEGPYNYRDPAGGSGLASCRILVAGRTRATR